MPSALPPLNALKAFVYTARWQSVSRAAEALHVTHGAISRQLRQLQQTLPQPLFEREGRGLKLTSAGEQLYRASASAFEQLQAAWHAQRATTHPPSFVLGCPGSLLARWMIPRMERLRQTLPDIQLHLSALEAPLAPALPGLDAALLIARPPWPAAWRTYPLAAEQVGPVLSPRHPRYPVLQNAPVAALADEPLMYTASTPEAWGQWAIAAGLVAETLQQTQGFEHLYYLLEAAVVGLGIAIAPAPLVADDLAAGRLAAPWGFAVTRGQWLLATPRHAETPAIAALLPWLRAELELDT